MNKKLINEIVIVEGKTDTNKLKKLFNVETIETNGSAINNKTLNLIKKLSHSRGIILLLDPDNSGEKIRKTIINFLDDESKFIDLYITKKDISKSSKKIGIAEATDESLINLFNNKIEYANKKNNSISWDEYLDLNINNKQKRLLITNKLNITYCNNKQLFKRLNYLQMNKNDILELIKYEDTNK